MLAGIRGRGAMPQPSVVAPHKKGSASGTSGAYTKLNLIGKGSFGAVYQVRHTQKGGETLVLKEVQTKGLASSEIRATKQEISVLKRVKHPHIIGYVNTFEENGVVSIVMERSAPGPLMRSGNRRRALGSPRRRSDATPRSWAVRSSTSTATSTCCTAT